MVKRYFILFNRKNDINAACCTWGYLSRVQTLTTLFLTTFKCECFVFNPGPICIIIIILFCLMHKAQTILKTTKINALNFIKNVRQFYSHADNVCLETKLLMHAVLITQATHEHCTPTCTRWMRVVRMAQRSMLCSSDCFHSKGRY